MAPGRTLKWKATARPGTSLLASLPGAGEVKHAHRSARSTSSLAEWLEGLLKLAGQSPGGIPLVGRDDELDVVTPAPALDVDVADMDPAAVSDRLVLEHHRALVAG